MTGSEIYIELGTRTFGQINRINEYVKRCIAVDIEDKWYKKGLCDVGIEFYHMSTDAFYADWKKHSTKVDLIFIDALHTHEQSYKDFCNFKEFIRDDGIILLHDTYPPSKRFTSKDNCNDVWKTPVLIKENHKNECEMCTIPGSFGITIIRMNRGKQMKWMGEN